MLSTNRKLFVSLLCGGMILGAGLPVRAQRGAQEANPAVGAQRDLRSLFDQLRTCVSIDFHASVEVSVGEAFAAESNGVLAPQRGTTGIYHYAASGDFYKIESFVDPKRYPGLNTQAAYDGTYFYLWLQPANVVSRSSHDNRTLLPVLPNPLFELVRFRYPATDENVHERLRFSDIQNDVVPVGFWDVEWTTVMENGVVLERARFPGGAYEGKNYDHFVYCVPGARDKPVRIDCVTADGIKLASTEFSHYFAMKTNAGVTYWPRSIVLRGFAADGTEAGRYSYLITDLSLDQDVPAAQFVLKAQAGVRPGTTIGKCLNK